MTLPHWPRSERGVLAQAAVLAVLLRVPFFRWPLTADEGAYAYTAYWWQRGLTLYSADLWLDRPQGIFLAYQLGINLIGPATWQLRLWGSLWAAATAVALYVVARHLTGPRPATAATFLYVLFSVALSVEGPLANAEVFMLLPATLSVWCLLAGWPLPAGLLAALAALLKPSGVTVVGLAVLWYAYQRAGWRTLGFYALGAGAPTLLALGAAATTVGLPQYLYSIALYRLPVNWTRAEQPWALALVQGLQTLPVWGPLAIVGLPGLFRLKRDTAIFVGLWLLTAGAGVAMGGDWWGHYFQQVLPPLAVAAGAGAVYLWDSGKHWARLEAVGVPLVFLALFVFPPYLMDPLELARMHHAPGYRVAPEVAAYLKQHTGPDETVYVAFFEPGIYYLAERRSAFPYHFPVQVAHFPGAQQQLVASIAARTPSYVFLADALPPSITVGLPFWEALQAGYVLEREFEGLPLYRRR